MVATDVASRGIGMIEAMTHFLLPLPSSIDVVSFRTGALLSLLSAMCDSISLTWYNLFFASLRFERTQDVHAV